jgi:hypothetical protein
MPTAAVVLTLTLTANMLHFFMLLLLVGAMPALVSCVHTAEAGLAMCVKQKLLCVLYEITCAARHQLEHYHTHIRYV